MTKFDIKDAEYLIEKLNNKYKKNVTFQFQGQHESCFYYNIENNIINYNNAVELENNQSYDYFYIDAILHEYGHAYHTQTLFNSVRNFIELDEPNCNISYFSEIINMLINNGIQIDNYPNLLFRTLQEIFADYFLLKNHNTFNPNSNINLFLKQRVENIIKNFEIIKNNQNNHFQNSTFFYYPIPELIKNMQSEQINEEELYKLGISYCNSLIEIFKMQFYNDKTIFITLENKYLSILSNILEDINNKL